MKQHNRRRGQALTEMAVVLPIVILCLFGVIELGRMLHAWVTVQYASRAAARVAITGQGETNGTRLTLILNEAHRLSDHLPGGVTVSVESWPGVVATGGGRIGNAGQPCELVQVEVRHTYQPVISLLGTIMPNNGQIPLVGSDRKINEPWTPCE